jgi:hypothetical protein
MSHCRLRGAEGEGAAEAAAEEVEAAEVEVVAEVAEVAEVVGEVVGAAQPTASQRHLRLRQPEPTACQPDSRLLS